MENADRFLNSETDSIRYESNSNMKWTMPSAHTLTFDIVKDKLYLSYTKLFGKTSLLIEDINTIKIPENMSTERDTIRESIDFKLGVHVDHVIMLHGAFRMAFVNLGVFAIDFDFMDKTDLLETALGSQMPVLGDGLLMPVLNFGTTAGSKIQVLLELDVLPLVALKTGIIYNF